MREALARAAEILADCADAPVWPLPDADLVAALDEAHRLEQRLAAVKLALIREIDGRDVAAGQGATSTGVWLRDKLRITVPAARRLLELAKTLDGPMVAVREAIAAGAVTLEQAQVIAAAVRDLPGSAGAEAADKAVAVLLDAAGQFDPSVLRSLGERILTLVAPDFAEERERVALERQERQAHRRRCFTISPDGLGSMRLTGVLDTEGAALVMAALDPLSGPGAPNSAVPSVRDERSPAQRRAHALVEVCRLALHCGDLPDHGGDRPQIVVTVGYDALAGKLGAGTLDTGVRLAAETVRRLACDARLLPAVLDGNGQPLDVGRERRLFTGPLRRALVLRDRGCALPGCDCPARWCDGHHVVSWADGGPTAMTNAVLLCRHHHRLVHHSDWSVRIAGDGHPEFLPPAHLDAQRLPRRNRYHRRN